MSLNEFEAIPLTQEQVNSNYNFKAIQNVVDLTNSKVYSDIGNHMLVVSNTDNTFVIDPGVGDVIVLGTDCTTDEFSNYNVKVGHYGDYVNSDTNIMIGHNSDCFNTDNNIVISHDTDINGGDENIIIGHNNDFTGSRNTVIGGYQNLGGAQDDMIIISNRPQAGFPVSGSVVIGGSAVNAPSALPKVQLLSDTIVPLINNAGNAVYDPADPAANQATNGWLRLKYQGRNIKIPILDDTDLAIP